MTAENVETPTEEKQLEIVPPPPIEEEERKEY